MSQAHDENKNCRSCSQEQYEFATNTIEIRFLDKVDIRYFRNLAEGHFNDFYFHGQD